MSVAEIAETAMQAATVVLLVAWAVALIMRDTGRPVDLRRATGIMLAAGTLTAIAVAGVALAAVMDPAGPSGPGTLRQWIVAVIWTLLAGQALLLLLDALDAMPRPGRARWRDLIPLAAIVCLTLTLLFMHVS